MRLGDGGVVLSELLGVYVDYPKLDFEDALSVAHVAVEGREAIVSYDEGFDAVTDVVRKEP